MYIEFRVHGSGVRVEGWGLGFGVTCPVSSPPAPEQTRQADPAQGPAVLLSSSWSLRSQKERESYLLTTYWSASTLSSR